VTEFGDSIGRFGNFETCFGLACIYVEGTASDGRSFGIGLRRQNSIVLMAVCTRNTVIAIDVLSGQIAPALKDSLAPSCYASPSGLASHSDSPSPHSLFPSSISSPLPVFVSAS